MKNENLAICLLPLFLLAAAEPATTPDVYAARVAETKRECAVRSQVGPVETPIPLEIADFLLDHPDLSASIARRHKLAPYQIAMRTPTQSWGDDGDGSSGEITLVEHPGNDRTYYAEGTHRSSLFPPIRASAVILLKTTPVSRKGCRPSIVSSFEVYVRLRNPFLSGLVKILRPFVQKTVVRKFSKAFLVAREVGRLLAENPGPVSAEILSYPDLSPENRLAAQKLLEKFRGGPPACL